MHNMAPRGIGWIVVGLIAMGSALALAWQHRATQQLRIERDAAVAENRELAAVRAKHAKLTAELVPPEELERLRGDRAALVRLRKEIEQLKARAEVGPPPRAAALAAGADPEQMIQVEQMRNAGRDTPRAAGETFVWALQRGDIDTAASLLTFVPGARTKMEQILATLPPQFRADYGTPERLMAFVMAGNSSVAAIRFIGAMNAGPDTATQLLEVKQRSGVIIKDSQLLRREPDGWRRLITLGTVETLEKFLAASPPAFHVEATRK